MKIRAKAEPFIKWLAEADEEDESTDDDDDGDLEVNFDRCMEIFRQVSAATWQLFNSLYV